MFVLTPELIDQIIFAMEDQSENYVLDTESLEVKAESFISFDEEFEEEESFGGPGRYVDIPEWNSFKGFQLMERFVAGLRNPVYQDALRNALSRGKGVFRHFKNVLKQNEEIERLWYTFKEREMKREVKEWYEGLCAMESVEGLPIDLEHIEETEDLVLTDFLFDTAAGGLEDRLKELDRIAFEEVFPDAGAAKKKSLYSRRIAGLPPADSEDSVFLIARTPGGELGGFVWGVKADVGTVRIIQLYILPEYRGLGLAKECINQFFLTMEERGIEHIELELYGTGLGLRDYLEKEGMTLYMARYEAETKRNYLH